MDDVGIRNLMTAYNAALNGDKTTAVLPFYTQDGLFMAPFRDSAIGIEAVGFAYDKGFQEPAFNVTFPIDECFQMSPTYAYVRTHSSGATHQASTAIQCQRQTIQRCGSTASHCPVDRGRHRLDQ